mgnify:CR=1 FL=1
MTHGAILEAFSKLRSNEEMLPLADAAKCRSESDWLVGINAVKSLWDQAAKAANLEAIPTDGAFDPNLHDAVGEEESETVASGNIVRVLQGGWSLHGLSLIHISEPTTPY